MLVVRALEPQIKQEALDSSEPTLLYNHPNTTLDAMLNRPLDNWRSFWCHQLVLNSNEGNCTDDLIPVLETDSVFKLIQTLENIQHPVHQECDSNYSRLAGVNSISVPSTLSIVHHIQISNYFEQSGQIKRIINPPVSLTAVQR